MDICRNFRDVGEWVNIIAGHPLLPERRLLRGGKLDAVESADQIGAPGTIINLRQGIDYRLFGADGYQVSIANRQDVYYTTHSEVRAWLNDVVSLFELRDLRYPVLVHCAAGKDRTGVVVAALLHILELPEDVIIEEYLLSEGTSVDRAYIQLALDGLGRADTYFKSIDLAAVRASLRGSLEPPLP